MKTAELEHFVLDNFEGPIDYLLHLIQQEEIPIHEVILSNLTTQFLAKFDEQPLEIDSGAEFIGTTAFLIWLKSKTLLPKHEQAVTGEEEEGDPRFAIIHQLLDYCRFKDAAKSLEQREVHQNAYYARGLESAEVKKNLGIEHLTLQDLASMFQQILSKAEVKGSIEEEEWKVSDKIDAISRLLENCLQIPFEQLFTESLCRLELIVTFLALLEMMKRGSVRVVRFENKVMIQA
ncbi:MAG: segregation/condensation protein A [Parachlamydia sp.]|nr:segregation/condensation protein A [Parachlamydia sp.]